MASLVLSQVSTSMLAPSLYGAMANGASIAASGALWSAAQSITGALGTIAGSVLDRMLFAEDKNYHGPRLNDLTVQTSTEGASLPIVYGTMRLAGNVIWSTGLEEIGTTTSQGGGGSGGGGGGSSTTYTYRTDCAVAVCEGTITGIRRIWADTKLIYDVGDSASLETLTASNQNNIRFYTGSETQLCDPLIQAVENGTDLAFRGTAYVVFEDLQLANYGNRLPNFSFEVVKTGNISSYTFDSQYQIPGTYADVHYHSSFQDENGVYIWGIDASISTSPRCTAYLCMPGKQPIEYKSFNAIIPSTMNYWEELLQKGHGYAETTNIFIISGLISERAAISIINIDGTSSIYDLGVVLPWAYRRVDWYEKDGVVYIISLATGTNSALYFYKIDLKYNTKENLSIPTGFNFFSNLSHAVIMGIEDNWLYLSFTYDGVNNYIRRYNITTNLWDTANVWDSVGLVYQGGNNFYPYRVKNGLFYLRNPSYILTIPISSTVGTTYFAYNSPYPGINDSYNDGEVTSSIFFYFFNRLSFRSKIYWYTKDKITIGTQTVKEVVEDIVSRGGVPSSKYDFSSLSSSIVRGYTITKQMKLTEALSPVSATYSFDISEEDAKLKAKMYNTAVSVKTFNKESDIGGNSI